MVVADFMDLNDNEYELSKNDIAKYLDLYYRFSEKVGKKYLVGESFKQLFFSCTSPEQTILDNTMRTIDYDYMLQIARFFTIIKIYSLSVDSNITHLELADIDDPNMLSKYEVPGSRHHNVIDALKLIRNALNHNDKKDFELFRIISEDGNPDLSIEIYLRRPNLHLKMPLKEFDDILVLPFKSKSVYGFEFLDFDDDEVKNTPYLKELLLMDGLKYRIKHQYDFSESDITDGIVRRDSGDSFERVFSFNDEQKNAIWSNYHYLQGVVGDDVTDFLPFIIRDAIPFGMTKIDDYLFDLNYLFPTLEDWKKGYIDIVRRLESKKGYSAYDEANSFYRSLNLGNVSSRGFSLFASYVLDSVVCDDDVVINSSNVPRNHLRNSFVHGRWFNRKDGLKDRVALFDYENGDENILDRPHFDSYYRDELYSSLKQYVPDKSVDLPISFISYGDDGGSVIACRVDGVDYFCNMTIYNTGFPQYVIFKKSGIANLGLADEEERTMFCEKLRLANKSVFNSEFAGILDNLEEPSAKAYQAFIDYDEDGFYEAMNDENIALAMAVQFPGSGGGKSDDFSTGQKGGRK